MSYYSGKSRSYRFPGHESVLSYEKDHYMYCPPADTFTSMDGFSYDSYGSFSIPMPTTYSEKDYSQML